MPVLPKFDVVLRVLSIVPFGVHLGAMLGMILALYGGPDGKIGSSEAILFTVFWFAVALLSGGVFAALWRKRFRATARVCLAVDAVLLFLCWGAWMCVALFVKDGHGCFACPAWDVSQAVVLLGAVLLACLAFRHTK